MGCNRNFRTVFASSLLAAGLAVAIFFALSVKHRFDEKEQKERNYIEQQTEEARRGAKQALEDTMKVFDDLEKQKGLLK